MSHSGAAAAASFGPGGLPPGLTGTNDRSTMLVSNFEVQVGGLGKLTRRVWDGQRAEG